MGGETPIYDSECYSADDGHVSRPLTGMSEKVVYLMRGLPSCGKSHSAEQLAGDSGLVCETDAYFFTQVGDDALSYDYDASLLAAARRWNRDRFKQAVKDGISPIVVDRGNSLSVESQRYARFAVEHGYAVELKEPASAWWQEIRVLLKYKQHTKPILMEWSKQLAAMNRSTHRVSANGIRRRMAAWKHDLTVQDILDYEPNIGDAAALAKPAARNCDSGK